MMPVPCVPWATTNRADSMGRADSGRLQPAWLLHRRPFRNTSLIVELFVEDLGRVGAVVRGGRKDPSLAPFMPLWVELKSAGELYSLRHCEPRGSRLPLQGKALYCGFYLNELLTRLLHRDDAHPDLWSLYEQTLLVLQQAPQLDVTLRQFELALLEDMGYGIALGYDVHGAPVRDQGRYLLDPEQGLLVAEQGYLGADLHAIINGHWHDDARRTARHLCRALLAPHLGNKPLKSRELFREK